MVKIIKANGEEVSYSPNKIMASLKRAGATQDIIQQVLNETEKFLYEGINTKALYKIVFGLLKQISHSTAGKYHLKTAIMELGPSGFPFEKFIAALLQADGYDAVTNQIVQGHCVKHEVDIIAQKDNKLFLFECKFHNDPGNICDVKIALYVHARFLDIEKKWLKFPEESKRFHRGWLVTNTRLSADAEQYGTCAGLGLLSWNYPQGNGIRDIIDRKSLYPITCISELTQQEKQTLLHRDIVLCSTLYEHPAKLKVLGLSEARVEKILDEAQKICKKEY